MRELPSWPDIRYGGNSLNKPKNMTLIARLFALFFICSTFVLQADVKEADLIGTWKWASVGDKAVSKPFYLRLSANHAGMSWPTPADWSSAVNGVSKGTWSLQDNFFTIDTTQNGDPHKSRIEVRNGTMILTTVDGVQLLFRRIAGDLLPGKLDPSTARAIASIKTSDIVGTWKLTTTDGAPAEQTSYFRYYPGGKAVAWPSPDAQGGNKAVSDFDWSLDGGYLTFASPDGSNRAKTWLVIGPQSMTLITEDQVEQVFKRISPDLEPGKIH
jgi:hypothetical protein